MNYFQMNGEREYLRNSQAHCLVTQADTRPKPAKELALPTHGQTGIKHETLTSCIVPLAVCANIEGVTSNNLCSGSTGLCFESPNDTIHVTVVCNTNKDC